MVQIATDTKLIATEYNAQLHGRLAHLQQTVWILDVTWYQIFRIADMQQLFITLEICTKFYFLINNAIYGVTKINTLLKIQNLAPGYRRDLKTHNLISAIKSEGTYRYVQYDTKLLTCIGCHIGIISIRSDRT